ncbi:MAG: hypothetical protein ACO1SX_05985 [Actinomycetota bacterium]
MNIILPILIVSLGMGLLVRRMTTVHWLVLSAWIIVVLANYYVKH